MKKITSIVFLAMAVMLIGNICFAQSVTMAKGKVELPSALQALFAQKATETQLLAAFKKGSIKIFANKHIINFPDEKVIARGIYKNDGKAVPKKNVDKIFCLSIRVGYLDEENKIFPSAFGKFLLDKRRANVLRTVNSDKVLWFATLKGSDAGKIAWFYPPEWNIIYGKGMDHDPSTIIMDKETFLVQYGNYRKSEITIGKDPDTGVFRALLNFNYNGIGGVFLDGDDAATYGLREADIKDARWNSDLSGWESEATAVGLLEKNEGGNFFFYIELPYDEDEGMFSLGLTEGHKSPTAWIAMDDFDLVGASVEKDGFLYYKME